jgi:hypothetical protein
VRVLALLAAALLWSGSAVAGSTSYSPGNTVVGTLTADGFDTGDPGDGSRRLTIQRNTAAQPNPSAGSLSFAPVGSSDVAAQVEVRLSDASTYHVGPWKEENPAAVPAGAGQTVATSYASLIRLDCTNGAPDSTIDTITGGTEGQILVLYMIDADCILTDTAAATANTINHSGVTTFTADDTITLIHDGNKWFEVGRSTN